MRRTVLLSTLAVAVLLGLASSASAAVPTVYKLKGMWATVNVCDNERDPSMVGIRASMPGTGSDKDKMRARVRLQYFRESTGAWVDIVGGDRRWSLGTGGWERRETGENIPLYRPDARDRRVRARVTFEWRRGKRVFRRGIVRTHARAGRVTGARPRGFSAAECRLMPELMLRGRELTVHSASVRRTGRRCPAKARVTVAVPGVTTPVTDARAVVARAGQRCAVTAKVGLPEAAANVERVSVTISGRGLRARESVVPQIGPRR